MANRVIYFILSAYFWVGALWSGYFTEMSFLIMNLIIYLAFMGLVLYKRELTFKITDLFLVLFIFEYWISLLYAVDVEQAILEASRVSSLLPFSLMISLLPREQLYRIYRMWPWIGSAVTIIGIVLGMYRNGRLESTFFYANVLAILLLINILICIQTYLQERRILYMVLLTVNATGLLLTFSRSVWVLWFVVIGAAIILVKELRNRHMVFRMGLAHLCSLVIAFIIKNDLFFFWQRVSSIQSDTSEFQIRLVYWKDSLSLIRDFGWGGTGGGGWNVLIPHYHSQDYYVKFVHNHYIQVTLDIGVIGLLVFSMWVVIPLLNSIVRMMRSKIEYESPYFSKMILLMLIAILLHAGFDIDFTFPLMTAVLISLMASIEVKQIRIRLSIKTIRVVAPLMLVIVGWWGWLAVGYGYNLEGNRLANEGHYEEAQATLAKSAKILPWSSSVLYNSAKGYVLQGNDSGVADYYQMASMQLRLAHGKVPEQTLYTELLKDIK